MGKSLFKNKMILLIVALIFALIGTSLFVGNRQIKIANEITVAEDLTGPTESTEGYWTDEGRRGDSFAGGDGLTEETAYEIATAEQLAYLAYSVNNGNSYSEKYFKQTADIDLSKYYWEPIGNSNSNNFVGVYDGGQFSISGLFTKSVPTSFTVDYFTNPNAQNPDLGGYHYKGLFGYCGGYSSFHSILKNINIVSSKIYGMNYVGGIVGYTDDCSINNCHFSGTVIGHYYVGGIVGRGENVLNSSNKGNIYGQNYTIITITSAFDESGNEIPKYDSKIYLNDHIGGIGNAIVDYSFNEGVINGNSDVGGVVGGGTVYNSYNTGKITGKENVGGIAGTSDEIINCYNSGYIYEGVNVGGILGATGYTSNLIINCFNIGTFESNSQSGALVGISYGNNVQIFNCYYNNNYGQLNSVYKNECTKTVNNSVHLETLMSKSSDLQWYTDENNWFAPNLWNFDYIWQINEEVNENIPIKFQGETNIIYWTDEEVVGNHQGFEEEGTEEDPYLIEDEYDLAYLSYSVLHSQEQDNYYKKYFKQTKDLDMSKYAWTPIGQADSDYGYVRSFSGIYDGDYHTVSGINTYFDIIDYDEGYKINDSYLGAYYKLDNQGLFGVAGCGNALYEHYAQIKNLGVINSNIQGRSYVGAIVGQVVKSIIISKCYNEGSVYGTSYVGGIAGLCNATGQNSISAYIVDSYNKGTISFKGYSSRGWDNMFGGIAGEGAAINCYNIGEINVQTVVFNGYVGGITGSGSTINCFNAGEIKGFNIAGITGTNAWVYYKSESHYNNYSVGKLTAQNKADAIIYKCDISDMISVESNYYSSDVGEGVTSQYGELNEQLSIETFKNIDFYLDDTNWYIVEDLLMFGIKTPWDFKTTWEFREGENDGFPVLMVYRPTYWRDYRAESFSGGDGLTEETAYEIETAEQLAYLAYMVNNGSLYTGKYFKQTANIDLSAHLWISIGLMNMSSGEMYAFGGNYNGNNYYISGLNINDVSYTNGLFGLCANMEEKSCIENVILINSKISGGQFSGGIVGYATNYQIINCINYADIKSTQIAAGIAGYAENIDVINCLNFGTIEADSDMCYCGGISGAMSGSIINCGNEGKINGLMSAAICGIVDQCQISNCYSISNDDIILANGGTISNCLYINANGKFYVGATDTEGNNITSFAEFAWINENSCPIPKSLTWLGQYFTQDITELITKDPEWKNAAA